MERKHVKSLWFSDPFSFTAQLLSNSLHFMVLYNSLVYYNLTLLCAFSPPDEQGMKLGLEAKGKMNENNRKCTMRKKLICSQNEVTQ